jgi:hypothetical protein
MKLLIGFSVMLTVLLSVMPAAPALAYLQPPLSYYHSLLFNLGTSRCGMSSRSSGAK